MRHITLSLLLGCSTLLGCSGSVQYGQDEGGAGGGVDGGAAPVPSPEGGAPPSTLGGAPPSTSGGAPPTSGGSGGGFQVPQTECGIACEVLFQCGLVPAAAGTALCPGLVPADQAAFSGFCVPQCEDQPVALSLIDGEDCAATVDTISSVSTAFQEICVSGF